MTAFDEFLAAGGNTANTDPLGRATDACLSRYKGTSCAHTASDLWVFLTWCAEGSLEPLTVQRLQIELYVRWLQEVRRFRPSTVSRRLSVVSGFYRTCVIDGVLEHSPADHVRRTNVPPESPTLGLSHLQFEALLSAARPSAVALGRRPTEWAVRGMSGDTCCCKGDRPRRLFARCSRGRDAASLEGEASRRV